MENTQHGRVPGEATYISVMDLFTEGYVLTVRICDLSSSHSALVCPECSAPLVLSEANQNV